MEHQNIINLRKNTTNQPFKYKKRNCVEVNDDGAYNTSS